MRYNFDDPPARRNTGSLKWDVKENELPMWVADMDFETAPEIRSAIEKRASHGIFGYTVIPDSWSEAYSNWWEKRHGFKIEKDWLIFCTGVVPAISSAVRKLTTPAEKVVIQTPVYNIFFNSIINNGRRVLESPLKYENGEYSVDFDDLEKMLSDPETSLMILCNPHNPVGKIWDRTTLEKIGELCKKYGVTVFSDEIHCDITDPGTGYIPFASVSGTCKKISVTAVAPTKAFNIAGIQTAAVFVPDEILRNKMRRGLNTDEVAEPNVFAAEAAAAAFMYGGDWLDELREYIYENKKFAAEYLKNNIPQLRLVNSQATYLLWAELLCAPGKADETAEFIRSDTGLYVSEGGQYGGNGGSFLRINIACPRNRLKDGLGRLKKGLDDLEKSKA